MRLREHLRERVDLLKLDIEGAETSVLTDCADALDDVQLVFVEYHSFEHEPQRFHDVVTVLHDAGFRLHFGSAMTSASPFIGRSTIAGMDAQLDIYGYR